LDYVYQDVPLGIPRVLIMLDIRDRIMFGWADLVGRGYTVQEAIIFRITLMVVVIVAVITAVIDDEYSYLSAIDLRARIRRKRD
jgi:hypothetical protein